MFMARPHGSFFSGFGLNDKVVLILYPKSETALTEVPDCDTDSWTAERMGLPQQTGVPQGKEGGPSHLPVLHSLSQTCMDIIVFSSFEQNP